MAKCLSVLVFTCVFSVYLSATNFDHSHTVWSQLLRSNVVMSEPQRVSLVDYRSLADQRPMLHLYLQQLSEVPGEEFDSWTTEEQLAFLINAYNAWTIELILTRYPDVQSIKDLGSWGRSPWKRPIVSLFGGQLNLDNLEHDLMLNSGRYPDPRIHFAINCGSKSCPPLRAEAYTPDSLEQQLEQQTHYFMLDKERNRKTNDGLAISSLFKWYRDDFEQGWQNVTSLSNFLTLYAEELNLTSHDVGLLARGKMKIDYLPYNWSLNSLE